MSFNIAMNIFGKRMEPRVVICDEEEGLFVCEIGDDVEFRLNDGKIVFGEIEQIESTKLVIRDEDEKLEAIHFKDIAKYCFL